MIFVAKSSLFKIQLMTLRIYRRWTHATFWWKQAKQQLATLSTRLCRSLVRKACNQSMAALYCLKSYTLPTLLYLTCLSFLAAGASLIWVTRYPIQHTAMIDWLQQCALPLKADQAWWHWDSAKHSLMLRLHDGAKMIDLYPDWYQSLRQGGPKLRAIGIHQETLTINPLQPLGGQLHPKIILPDLGDWQCDGVIFKDCQIHIKDFGSCTADGLAAFDASHTVNNLSWRSTKAEAPKVMMIEGKESSSHILAIRDAEWVDTGVSIKLTDGQWSNSKGSDSQGSSSLYQGQAFITATNQAWQEKLRQSLQELLQRQGIQASVQSVQGQIRYEDGHITDLVGTVQLGQGRLQDRLLFDQATLLLGPDTATLQAQQGTFQDIPFSDAEMTKRLSESWEEITLQGRWPASFLALKVSPSMDFSWIKLQEMNFEGIIQLADAKLQNFQGTLSGVGSIAFVPGAIKADHLKALLSPESVSLQGICLLGHSTAKIHYTQESSGKHQLTCQAPLPVQVLQGLHPLFRGFQQGIVQVDWKARWDADSSDHNATLDLDQTKLALDWLPLMKDIGQAGQLAFQGHYQNQGQLLDLQTYHLQIAPLSVTGSARCQGDQLRQIACDTLCIGDTQAKLSATYDETKKSWTMSVEGPSISLNLLQHWAGQIKEPIDVMGNIQRLILDGTTALHHVQGNMLINQSSVMSARGRADFDSSGTVQVVTYPGKQKKFTITCSNAGALLQMWGIPGIHSGSAQIHWNDGSGTVHLQDIGISNHPILQRLLDLAAPQLGYHQQIWWNALTTDVTFDRTGMQLKNLRAVHPLFGVTFHGSYQPKRQSVQGQGVLVTLPRLSQQVVGSMFAIRLTDGQPDCAIQPPAPLSKKVLQKLMGDLLPQSWCQSAEIPLSIQDQDVSFVQDPNLIGPDFIGSDVVGSDIIGLDVHQPNPVAIMPQDPITSYPLRDEEPLQEQTLAPSQSDTFGVRIRRGNGGY